MAQPHCLNSNFGEYRALENVRFVNPIHGPLDPLHPSLDLVWILVKTKLHDAVASRVGTWSRTHLLLRDEPKPALRPSPPPRGPPGPPGLLMQRQAPSQELNGLAEKPAEPHRFEARLGVLFVKVASLSCTPLQFHVENPKRGVLPQKPNPPKMVGFCCVSMLSCRGKNKKTCTRPRPCRGKLAPSLAPPQPRRRAGHPGSSAYVRSPAVRRNIRKTWPWVKTQIIPPVTSQSPDK